jgi:hypothetical protein
MIGGALLVISAVLMQPGLPGPAPASSYAELRSGAVTAPIAFYKDHIFVTLTVNGTPGMQFLLDTGASADILDMQTSQAMGLKPEGVVKEKDLGLGGGRVAVAAAKDVDVELDHTQIAHSLTLVDLHGLADAYEHRIDGILGFPLLNRYAVELDLERQMITLTPTQNYHYKGKGDILALADKKHSTNVRISINTARNDQKQAIVAIDTGSDVTLMLYPNYVYKAHLDGAFLGSRTIFAYGLGGYFAVQVGTLPAMNMGPLQTTGMTIFTLPAAPPLVQKKKMTCGVVGMAYLTNFSKVIFDVPHGHMILELKPVTTASKPVGPPPLSRESSLLR